MKTSSESEIRDLYNGTADAYAEMMDAEIDLPLYSDTLGRLAERIATTPGRVIDTSCGSGHMLSRYHQRHDPNQVSSEHAVVAHGAIAGAREVAACQTITVGPGVELVPGANLLLRAGLKVNFADFLIADGAEMEVRLEPELITE